MMDAEDREMYEVYFGKSKEYYMKQLEEVDGKRQTRFNVYAFFFTLFWCLFRKMYWYIILPMLFLGIVFTIMDINQLFDRISSILVASVFGMFVNGWYLKKADKIVNKAKTIFYTHEERLIYLGKKGGTSYIALILGIIIFGLLFLAGLYLEDLATAEDYYYY